MWITKIKSAVSASLLAVTLLTVGCAEMGLTLKKPADVVQMSPKDQVIAAVDQANVVILSLASTTLDYYNQSLLSYEDKTKYSDKLNEAAKASDKAREFAGLGDITNANTQMKIMNLAISVVKGELAKMQSEGK